MAFIVKSCVKDMSQETVLRLGSRNKELCYEILLESASKRILLYCYYAEHCAGSGFDGLLYRDFCNRNSLLVSLYFVLLWTVGRVYQSFCPETAKIPAV